MRKVEDKAITKIEEIVNPRTGVTEIFLNGKRLEDIGDDQTDIQLEILKNLLEGLPTGQDIDEKRNKILRKIASHLGNGNDSLISIKDVLVGIYEKIADSGASEEIERVKEELLVLIHLLDLKIEESKLVAGKGIIIEGNVISTTEQSHIDEVIEMYEKLKVKYKELQLINELLKNENSQLKSTLERLQREIDSLQVQLEKQQKDCDARISELTNNYEKIISNNNKTIRDLEKEVTRLNKIIEDSESASMLIKYQKEAEKWKSQYEELKDSMYINRSVKVATSWNPCNGGVSPNLIRQVCM